VTYRIKGWDSNYENNRTRELKHLDWVPMPNKMDGDGCTELLDHKDGASHLGAWVALIQIASRCDPRGTLLRDGARPHDFASLLRISRISIKVFEVSIPRFVEIGWVESIPNDSADMHDGAGKPQEGAGLPQQGDLEGKGREWNRREWTKE
jgi:hypothetical protein